MVLPEPPPMLNSIPPELIPRFEPIYVEYFMKYNIGRLQSHQVPIEKYRQNPAKYTTPYARSAKRDVYRVTEQKCPVQGAEISVRIFEPAAWKEGDRLFPVYVNYHGGGWTWGGLESDDPFCRIITDEVGCVTFDVDYRLAPEYKYPIPIEDSWAALKWVINEKAAEFHLDVKKVAIGGLSAGGHISAVLSHMARDDGISLALQILAVPCVDLVNVFTPEGILKPDCPYDSYRELYWTAALPVERMIYAHDCFVGIPRPAAYDTDWKLNPILAPNFSNLAPALVLTAEMDPLRDEGELYAQKLVGAGCNARHVRFERVPHVFMMYDLILDQAREYNREIIDRLRTTFAEK